MNTKILNNIKSGKKLEESLPVYITGILEKYYKMSAIRLSMNMYMFYENILENDYILVGRVKDILSESGAILKKYIDINPVVADRKNDIAKLNDIRKELTDIVTELVNYSTSYKNVEYVINRVEHRFDDKKIEVDNDLFIQAIVKYVFENNDNVVINDKIKLLLGQLPVRMARGKLLNIISNALTLYNDSDKESFDNFVETIRSSAMLYSWKDEYKEILNLNDALDKLVNTDFSNVEEEALTKLNMIFEEKSLRIIKLTDCYTQLMELVNDIYEIVLTCPYIMSEADNITSSCTKTILKLCELIIEENFDYEVTDISSVFELTEGEPEKLSEQITTCEGVLYGLSEDKSDIIDSLMLTNQFNCAKLCEVLNSSSTFAILNNQDLISKASEKVTGEYIEEVKDKLLNDISEKLSSVSGGMRRAIMAGILSELPVFFKNSDEVTEYIKHSITSCSDIAEKTAVYEIINILMGND